MRSALIVSMVLSVAACDSGGGDKYEGIGTLDSPYLVSISWVSSDCGESNEQEVKSGVVDVVTRPDGLIDIYKLADVPIPLAYRGVIVAADGKAEYSFDAMTRDGTLYPQKLSGTLTPASLDLKIESEVPFYDEDSRCKRVVRISGKSARIHDDAAIDGTYRVVTDITNPWCRGEPDSNERITNRPLSAFHLGGEKSRVMFEGVRVLVSLDRSGGDVDWKGDAEADGFFGTQSFPAELSGKLGPDGAELSYFLPEMEGSDCGVRAKISGARMRPSATSVDNDYLLTYTWNDPCGESGGPIEFPVRMMTQDDGTAWIYESEDEIKAVTTQPDGSFSMFHGSEAEGLITRMSGQVAPPTLGYATVYRYFSDEVNGWCEMTVEAFGRARYLPPPEHVTVSILTGKPDEGRTIGADHPPRAPKRIESRLEMSLK